MPSPQLRRGRSFSTLAGPFGVVPWSNPAESVTADGVMASVVTALSGNPYSHYLFQRDFNFSAPLDATGLSLVAFVSSLASQGTLLNPRASIELNYITPGTDELIAIGGFQCGVGAVTYNNTFPTSDLSITLDPSLVNDPAFGLAIRVFWVDGDGVTPVTASIDDAYFLLSWTGGTETPPPDDVVQRFRAYGYRSHRAVVFGNRRS